MVILGVMTGTSCDGLDAACVKFSRRAGTLKWNALWERSVGYPAELRKRVIEIQNPRSKHSTRAFLEIHRDLGLWYAKTLASMISRAPSGQSPAVIANHGQTVAHFPTEGVTLQMGDPSRIAMATGLTVTSHFREGDQAAGGEGAPMVPLFHQFVVQTQKPKGHGGIAVHNLGGISNLTYVGAKGKVLAFDTGPGNIWIDACVQLATHGKQAFDRGGKRAAAHEPDSLSLKRLMQHPYFRLAPPKSTGRDDFPFKLFRQSVRKIDSRAVATATQLTVDSIVNDYQKWILDQGLPLKEIYLSGGGAKNQTIKDGIAKGLRGVRVGDVWELGVNPQYMESQAFAYLGYRSLLGMTLGGPWTGARSEGPPGQITPGKNWTQVLAELGTQ